MTPRHRALRHLALAAWLLLQVGIGVAGAGTPFGGDDPGFVPPCFPDLPAQTFFLHHSATPVTVPDGQTSFYADGTAPTATVVTVQQLTVNSNDTQSFPAFTGTPLAADTTIAPCMLATLNLSATQRMVACAEVAVDVALVTPTGRTPLGSASTAGITIPQGRRSGTARFLPIDVGVQLPGGTPFLTVHAGESIAVTATVTNHCPSNRGLFLVYDATSAQSSVTFSCPCDAFLKCEDAVAKRLSTLTTGVIKCNIKDSDSVLKGKLFDGQACQDAAAAKYDAATGRLACPPCLLRSSLRDLTVALVNVDSASLFCDPTSGTPEDPPSMGFVPPDKTVAKCEDAAATNAAKLVVAIGKCHIKNTDSLFRHRLFDEEACETTAKAKYDAKAAKIAACVPCLDQAALRDTVELQVETSNGANYCASPGGAFLDGSR
jgi:hypothetical protein